MKSLRQMKKRKLKIIVFNLSSKQTSDFTQLIALFENFTGNLPAHFIVNALAKEKITRLNHCS